MPFRARPIQPVGYDNGRTWPQWLVDDQREASDRPDVVAFVSDRMAAPLKISGQPIANLVASTSGSDSDWVVKLIDVYPDEVAGRPAMGGYLTKNWLTLECASIARPRDGGHPPR